MILRLTDGATTVNLHGTAPVVGCTYRALAPELAIVRRSAVGQDGEHFAAADYRNIAEEAAVILEGSAATIQATLSAVERLLAQAKDRHAAGMGAKVWVEYQAHSAEDVYRCQLLAGRIVWPDEPIRRLLTDSQNTVEVTILWERAWYWEGPETTLQFVNQNAPTTPINSITIQNGAGGVNGNTAQVYSVAGQIPTPPKITITTASGSDLWAWKGWLWGDAHIGLSGSQHHIADTDSTSWATIDHSQMPINVAIPDATLQKVGGRPVRVLARFSSLSSQLYLRANIQHYINPLRLRLREGNEVWINSSGAQLVDLGAFPLPPGGNTATTGVEVGVSIYSNIAGSAALSFLQLAPADNLRVLFQDGFMLNSGAAWVDDPIQGITYYAIGGTRFPILRAEGPPVRLWPGKTNYLRFLLMEQGSHNAGRQFTIAAVYRPRRLAL